MSMDVSLFLRSKGGLVRQSGFFLRRAAVLHILLLSRDFALRRLALVLPEGLRVRGPRQRFEPRRGDDEPEPGRPAAARRGPGRTAASTPAPASRPVADGWSWPEARQGP